MLLYEIFNNSNVMVKGIYGILANFFFIRNNKAIVLNKRETLVICFSFKYTIWKYCTFLYITILLLLFRTLRYDTFLYKK